MKTFSEFLFGGPLFIIGGTGYDDDDDHDDDGDDDDGDDDDDDEQSEKDKMMRIMVTETPT